MIFRFHRNIIFGIFRRISLRISINSKQREISGMTRPFPVIGVASKTSNHIGWGSYQTYIVKILIYKIIVFISLKKRTNRNRVFSIFVIFVLNFSNFLIDNLLSFSLGHRVIYQRQNSFGNIVHPYEKTNRNTLWSQLFTFIFCPKSVRKIIVFRCRKLCNFIVSAMVVSKY